MGHGHVKPNPDGTRARCGGPKICAECARELVDSWAEAKVAGEKTFACLVEQLALKLFDANIAYLTKALGVPIEKLAQGQWAKLNDVQRGLWLAVAQAARNELLGEPV